MRYLVKFADELKPKRKKLVSDWADENRVLSPHGSSEYGRWRTSRTPYLREVMDCLSEFSDIDRVVLMFSAQSGKTESSINWLGYIIDHAGGSVGVVLPTIEFVRSWTSQRLDSLISDTASVRKRFGKRKTRDATNSMHVKKYDKGSVIIGGSNSPSSLIGWSARYLICDEVDAYPLDVSGRGDPLDLAEERIKSGGLRKKMFLSSTPTIKGLSRIGDEYRKSDKRRFHVPCPHCNEKQILKFSNLKWSVDEYGEVIRAWYVCEHCGCEIEEHQKTKMLELGEWVAENPGVKTRGYSINGLYSPVGLGFSWHEIAKKWIEAQSDIAKLKVFVNSTLAEEWEDESTKLKSSELLKRTEDIDQRVIPPGCLALTVGVDTQDEWLAVKLLGWGEGKLWVIEWHTIPGDTTRDEVWNRLEDYLNTPLINAYGQPISIDAVAIDVRGHRGEEVRRFIGRRTLKVPVFAVQGSTTRMGKAIASTASYPEKTGKGKIIKTGHALWNVGTEYCKDFIFGVLRSDEELPPEDRIIHFPQGLDESYFDGLLSEVFDPERNRYVQKKGAKHKRNEPLDTFVYAWAIGHHKQVRIGKDSRGRDAPGFWQQRRDIYEFEFMGIRANELQIEHPVPAAKTPGKISLNRWARG